MEINMVQITKLSRGVEMKTRNTALDGAKRLAKLMGSYGAFHLLEATPDSLTFGHSTADVDDISRDEYTSANLWDDKHDWNRCKFVGSQDALHAVLVAFSLH